MTKEDPFITGLRRIIDGDTNLSAAGVGAAAGLSNSTVRKLFSGNSGTPKHSTMLKIAGHLGLTVDQIVSAADASALPAVELQKVTDEAHALVDIWDIEASAGDGSLVPHDEALAGRMAFPPGYLADITSTSPDQLQIITVKGRSMQPTLHDGDVVMIDRTKRHLGNDGIYVIRIDDALHIKRISRSSTKGMIRILSDNHLEHGEFERPMAEVEALGRVIWAGKRM